MRTCTIAVVAAGLGTPSSTRLPADHLATAVRDRLTGATDAEVTGTAVEVLELHDLATETAQRLISGHTCLPRVLRRPVQIVPGRVRTPGTGGEAGTARGDRGAAAPRHSLVLEHALRTAFSFLRARAAPTAVYPAAEDRGGGAGADPLADRIGRAAEELATLVGSEERAGDGRSPATAELPGDAVVPITEQLAAVAAGGAPRRAPEAAAHH